MKEFKDFWAVLLLALSAIAVILAAIGASAAGRDVWLASTQWIMIAILLGIYAIFVKLEVK